MFDFFQKSKQFNRTKEKKELVYLGLGSNIGNRMENLRKAINFLVDLQIFKPYQASHIVETSAILPEKSPSEWNLPFLNMVISGTTPYAPQELLAHIKTVEKKIGRDSFSPKWSPRAIDIDILDYYDQKVDKEFLKIPHPEIKNRDFILYSLAELGWHPRNNEEEFQSTFEKFTSINHFVLYPKFVGIVNITPDSFSDGGEFLCSNSAEKQILSLISDGATMVDLGAQSTRPGYREVSAQTEIARLREVLERCYDSPHIRENVPISLDTYFDEVLQYAVQNYPGLVKCANVQQFRLAEESLKIIADNNLKIIIMLQGTNLEWINSSVKKLENYGIERSNVIIDPGIGFGKTKLQNIELIRHLHGLRQFGCEIMLGHSRKSFISSFFSSKNPIERDLETIAVSEIAYNTFGADYFRVHNVKDHMRFFVAKKMMQSS